MADISMCLNKKCPSKNGCYRFKATPNALNQSYQSFEFDERGRCDFYWDRAESAEPSGGKEKQDKKEIL